jgi:hypothetical protein
MANARICAKFGLQHNCPGRALVSLLSGEAALFQRGGLGGLTMWLPLKLDQAREARAVGASA